MNANQLNELATNAELNHWPAHLGVTTDAEKVAYLAARLREAAVIVDDWESHNSGGRRMSGVSGFEAGWKAAKAYYEARQ